MSKKNATTEKSSAHQIWAAGDLLHGLVRFISWQLCRLTGTAAMVVEFKQRRPNRCMICSFHSYGYRNGFEKNETPPKHDCCEANTIVRHSGPDSETNNKEKL